jgi:hypothetical protein
METPQYIYNLIAFSQEHIDNWNKYRERDDKTWEILKDMSREERFAWTKNNPREKIDLSTGKAYRGSFTDLGKLIEIVESQDDPYGICECYYTYLLIEKHHLNCIDGVCWGEDDGEIWYNMDENYQYKKIDKPDCFRQTVGHT